MIEQFIPEHHIQRHIMSVLMYSETARFRDLRPPRTDANLFSYHLKVLMKNHFVAKTAAGYQLSQNGLVYVDRVSTEKMSIRSQPKIISMLFMQNDDGKILLQKRTKQPFINCWTLPYGKLHIEDVSILQAAQREAYEKLGLKNAALTHAGDCYIRVFNDDEILTSTLAHIFRHEGNEVAASETLAWVSVHDLVNYALAPAVEQIIGRTVFRDSHFFEEFNETWYN